MELDVPKTVFKLPSASMYRMIILPTVKSTAVKKAPLTQTFQDGFASGRYLNNMENQMVAIIMEIIFPMVIFTKDAVIAETSLK